MRRIEEIIEDLDVTKKSGRKKARIISWFAKHPGERFDRAEVTAALGDELDIEKGQIGNYLSQLSDADILQEFGEKRIAYQLEDDILVPARFQARAVFRHLAAVFDYKRWGVAGFFAVATAMWAGLTFPFWFLWGSLIIAPSSSLGPITQAELLTIAIAMTLWLIVFIVGSTILYQGHRWYQRR